MIFCMADPGHTFLKIKKFFFFSLLLSYFFHLSFIYFFFLPKWHLTITTITAASTHGCLLLQNSTLAQRPPLLWTLVMPFKKPEPLRKNSSKLAAKATHLVKPLLVSSRSTFLLQGLCPYTNITLLFIQPVRSALTTTTTTTTTCHPPDTIPLTSRPNGPPMTRVPLNPAVRCSLSCRESYTNRYFV